MTDIPRLTDALSDRYRIQREIGSGGMATVYLAQDVRHDRQVAVKILRPEVSHVIGVERFLAEIKTTAHLQHPHILGLIDSGEINGTVFYVMPFVRGESLKERLEREQQLPIADAVRIATQVAGALDYAHRQGVIHRDIKPGNILLHDDQALVADFGIALAASRPNDGKRMTDTGMSIGTPHYMSPEQAMGERTLDARTDIYALGCVLYEMLTGEVPFDGANAQAIIAKVMSIEPQPVTTVRKTVPPNVAAATMTALNKLPADRFANAAAFAAALANPDYAGVSGVASTAPRGAVVIRRSYAIAAATAALVAAGAGIAMYSRGVKASESMVARFEIAVPDSMFSQQIAVSRDGKRVVWQTSAGVWERPLDSLSIRRVRDAVSAFGGIDDLSPDGREVLIGGGRAGIATLNGGPVRNVSIGGRGMRWSNDGHIYTTAQFGPGAGRERHIVRTAVTGGQVDTVAKVDSNVSINDLIPLPSGRGLLLSISHTNAPDSIVSYDLSSRKWIPLAQGTRARFVEPGFVVYVNGQSLMAAPMDGRTLAFTADAPQSVLDLPAGGITSMSAGGRTLVYQPVAEQSGAGIVVRSRTGTVHALANMPDSLIFSQFTVSQDGRRFAAVGTTGGQNGGGRGGFNNGQSNIWIYTFPNGPMQKLASNDRDQGPSWLPNNLDLSFMRVTADSQTTTSSLIISRWDQSAPPRTILTKAGGGGRGGPGGGGARGAFGPLAWFPDGREALVRVPQPSDDTTANGARGDGRGDGGRGRGDGRGDGRGGGGRGGRGGGPPSDIMQLTLGSPSRLDPYLATPNSESAPAVSPDGKLVAYTSDEGGTVRVYVRPRAGGAIRQVSINGGQQPRWSRSGRELFFTSNDTLFSATITNATDLSVDDRRPVFVSRALQNGSYAVMPGDTAFVTLQAPATSTLVVVANLGAELERLFGGKR